MRPVSVSVRFVKSYKPAHKKEAPFFFVFFVVLGQGQESDKRVRACVLVSSTPRRLEVGRRESIKVHRLGPW